MTDAKPETPLTEAQVINVEYPHGEYVAAQFARTLEKENAALRRALQALVRLKALSDRIDKDQATMAEQRDYRENKPLAWEKARACLAAISGTEGT